MKNDLGSKDTVITTINKPLNTLNQSDFDRLFYALKTKYFKKFVILLTNKNIMHLS